MAKKDPAEGTQSALCARLKKQVLGEIKWARSVINFVWTVVWIVRGIFAIVLAFYAILAFFFPDKYRRIPGAITSITGLMQLVAYWTGIKDWLENKQSHMERWQTDYSNILSVESSATLTLTIEALSSLMRSIEAAKQGKSTADTGIAGAAVQMAAHEKRSQEAQELTESVRRRSPSTDVMSPAAIAGVGMAAMGGGAGMGLATGALVANAAAPARLNTVGEEDELGDLRSPAVAASGSARAPPKPYKPDDIRARSRSNTITGARATTLYRRSSADAVKGHRRTGSGGGRAHLSDSGPPIQPGLSESMLMAPPSVVAAPPVAASPKTTNNYTLRRDASMSSIRSGTGTVLADSSTSSGGESGGSSSSSDTDTVV